MTAPAPPLPPTCNVLLVGGGGREHAIAWKLKQSPNLGKLWVTVPGGAPNAAILRYARECPQPMDGSNVFQMRRWCEKNDIHFIIIGPEAPLAAGLADQLASPTTAVFGPTKAASRLEWDKAWAKQMMKVVSVPTADARTFFNIEAARTYVLAHEDPCVVKATGLAAGKGAIVCETQEEALAAVERILGDREFGDAGKTILIEEKLSGQEVSVLALVDGQTISVLDPCQDHKQLNEGDTGPNTGGMGAYCPTPVVDAATMAVIERDVLVPIVHALRSEGIEYRGVLYAGLMLTPAGPKVLEFNCRFGDPECQVLLPRMTNDLLEVLWITATGSLKDYDIDFDPRVACCVVMAAPGYPEKYEKGKPITGIEDAEALSSAESQVTVFHAGTTTNAKGELVTNGGRVLGVTAMAHDLAAARDLANAACERISFPGAHYRRDIGDRVLASTRS